MADAKEVIKGILDQAIPQLQTTMASISQGCSGGSSGVPPENWAARQVPGNAAVEEFSRARAALGEDRITDTRQHINSALTQWDTLINSLSLSCSGGEHGEHPVNYGNYVMFRNELRERLKTALLFL
jgi:hypothetical protein